MADRDLSDGLYRPQPHRRGFQKAEIIPDIVMTALDADVIKAYVELDLGIGIIASMAFSPERDPQLKLLDATSLFRPTRRALRFAAAPTCAPMPTASSNSARPALRRASLETKRVQLAWKTTDDAGPSARLFPFFSSQG